MTRPWATRPHPARIPSRVLAGARGLVKKPFEISKLLEYLKE